MFRQKIIIPQNKILQCIFACSRFICTFRVAMSLAETKPKIRRPFWVLVLSGWVYYACQAFAYTHDRAFATHWSDEDHQSCHRVSVAREAGSGRKLISRSQKTQ